MLLILLSFGYSQNIKLTPAVKNSNEFCFDSLQVREIARLSVHEKIKDSIIIQQDSLISTKDKQIACYDEMTAYQDSVILANSLIIEKKDQNLKIVNEVCSIDKKIIKSKNKKRTNKLFIIIACETLLIFGLAVLR